MTADAFAARGLLWLLDGVAHAHDVTVDEMLGRSRTVHVVEARFDLWRRLRARGWSYPAIGALTGRDHKTVMSGCRTLPRVLPPRLAGPAPARKATPGVCALCAVPFEAHDGRPYCPACRRWRKKCWAAGIAAPVRVGAAE